VDKRARIELVGILRSLVRIFLDLVGILEHLVGKMKTLVGISQKSKKLLISRRK